MLVQYHDAIELAHEFDTAVEVSLHPTMGSSIRVSVASLPPALVRALDATLTGKTIVAMTLSPNSYDGIDGPLLVIGVHGDPSEASAIAAAHHEAEQEAFA